MARPKMSEEARLTREDKLRCRMFRQALERKAPTRFHTKAKSLRAVTPEWARFGRFQTMAVDLARPWRERPV